MYTEGTLQLRSPRGWRIKVGTWLSLVERTLGVGEVASSNLVVPTIYFEQLTSLKRVHPARTKVRKGPIVNFRDVLILASEK